MFNDVMLLEVQYEGMLCDNDCNCCDAPHSSNIEIQFMMQWRLVAMVAAQIVWHIKRPL